MLDLDPDDEKWVKARREVNSPEGIEFDAILRGWVEDRTVDEVVKIFNEAQVGCSRIMNAREMAENPHYHAREVHLEWEDQQLGKTVKGVGIVPKLSGTPGKIWRGSVPVGHDNNWSMATCSESARTRSTDWPSEALSNRRREEEYEP